MTSEAPPEDTFPADSLPEREVRHEFREIVRTVAIQPDKLGELYKQMLPRSKAQLQVICSARTREEARAGFSELSTVTPYVVKSVVLFKGGEKSLNRIILTGGGVDIPNPTEEDIRLEAARELEDETGHKVSVETMTHLRSDCTRRFSFTTLESDPKPILTINGRKESLVVAYIPIRQNTMKRFREGNENIIEPLRLNAEEVSRLIRQEKFVTASGRTGTLIDNLRIDAAFHETSGVTMNLADTIRTRTAIETETWVFEAQCWKQLFLSLAKTTQTHKHSTLIKRIRTIQQTPDPTDIAAATKLIGKIREAIRMVERGYPAKLKPIKHRLSKTEYTKLIDAGITKKMLHHRMILMDELRVAYRAAFMGK